MSYIYIFIYILYLCFYFVYGVREYSNFIDLHVTALLSQLNLLNRLSFCIVYFCLFCHILIDCRYVGLFLGCIFCSFALYNCFCANTTLLKQNNFVLGYIWLTMLWWFKVNSEETQPYIYMCPFFSKIPSHPGWLITPRNTEQSSTCL